jgi:hypothetical protein
MSQKRQNGIPDRSEGLTQITTLSHDYPAGESSLGQVQRALENDLAAYSIKKDTAVVYRNLSLDYKAVNRLEEAKNVLDEAHRRSLDVSLLENYERVERGSLRKGRSRVFRCRAVLRESNQVSATTPCPGCSTG